ncbi:cadherin repeat domain-containing protein [Erythrobacter sp. HA6-11]
MAGRKLSHGVAALAPSLQWDGTAGSGFSDLPTDPVRTSAKPAIRLIVPPNQHFTDELLVGFSAWANNEGSMLDRNGLSHVQIIFEGTSHRIPEPTLRSFQDTNGEFVAYRAWWVRLKRPQNLTGDTQLYAEAVPADPTMQSRVIGPYTFTLTDNLHDFEWTIDPDNPSAPFTSSDISDGLRAAWQAGANNPRIRVAKSGQYSVADVVVGAPYAGSGYATIEADEGVTATIAHDADTRGVMRNKYDRLRFKGANVILDMSSIEVLYNEGIGDHWLDGCSLIHTGGHTSLWNGTTRNGSTAVRNSPWFTEVSFEGIDSPVANANLVRGCKANHCYNDFAAQPRCLIGNSVTNHDSSFFRTQIDALSIFYSGSDDATLSTVTGGYGSSAYRRFTFLINGTEVVSYDSLTANWQSESGTYWVSDLVEFINQSAALSSWSAVLHDDTRQAGHVGLTGGNGSTFSAEPITSAGTTFQTFIDLHSDFSQMSASADTENTIIEANQVLDFQGQIVWLSSNFDIMDCFYVNNTFNEVEGFGGFSQVSRTGAKSHIVIAHNTLTNQELLLRDAPLSDFTLIANNVFENLTSDGAGIGSGEINDNHVYGSGNTIPGAVGTVLAGGEIDLFTNAAQEDFTPSGDLLANTKQPVVAYDRLGAKRLSPDAVGAQSVQLPDAVTMLTDLHLAQTKVSETGQAGDLVSTIENTTFGSSLKLSDSAGGRFALSNRTLVVGSAPLDFEDSQSYRVTVTETHHDAGNSPRNTSFDVTVLNVLEVELESLSLSAQTIPEGTAPGDIVGLVLNSSEGSNLSLVDDANGRFALSDSKLIVGLEPLDYEAETTHSITISESHPDSQNGPRETTLAIQVSNTAEELLGEIGLSIESVPENAPVGSPVANFTNKTPGSTLTLLDDATSHFVIEGDMLLLGAEGLDYEVQAEHQIVVRETHSDAMNSARDTTIAIRVANVGEITLNSLNLSRLDIEENTLAGTIVGSILGQTDGSTVTLYDDADGHFEFDGQNLIVGQKAADFEANQSLQIVLRETHPEGANSPMDTEIVVSIGDLAESASPVEELAAALIGSSQSGFADLRQANGSSDWIASDLSGHGNNFVQTFSAQKPVIDTELGAIFSPEAATHNIRYPISGGLFTVILSFTKHPDDVRGTPISNGSSNPGRYQDGGGGGLTGDCFVDGMQVSNANAFHDALDDGEEHLIVWQNIDAADWSELVIGRASDSLGGIVRKVVTIDQSTVQDLSFGIEKALVWLAAEDASSSLAEEPASSISYPMTLSGARDGELGLDPTYWHDVAAQEAALDLSVGTATHFSVRSGNWSSASTWENGNIPTAGAIVEIRHVVIYDTLTPVGDSSVGKILSDVEDDAAAAHAAYAPYALKGVILTTGARLRFDPAVQTFLLTENLFAHGGSEIEIGNAGNPVSDSGLTYAERSVPQSAIGLIGLEDPAASMRLGMVTLGKLRMWGKAKSVAAFAEDVSAGSPQLSLAQDVDGWNVGDRILIPGTAFTDQGSQDPRYTGPLSYWGPAKANYADMSNDWPGDQHVAGKYKASSQDEIRTIVSIDGHLIALDEPLHYDHLNYPDVLDDGTPTSLQFPVQNLTRSICIFGFCTDEKGAGAYRRAHTAHLFHDDCVRKFVEFKDLGRSRIDPSLFIAEQNDTSTGLRASQTGGFVANPENVAGRYAVYDRWSGPFLGRRAIVSEGLAIHNSPGTVSPSRGYVQHHSRAHVKGCIAHGFRATGFSSGTGTEIGQWEGCYASNLPGDGFTPSAFGDRHELI